MKSLIERAAAELYEERVKLGDLVGHPFTQNEAEFVNSLVFKNDFINPKIPLVSKIKRLKSETGVSLQFFTPEGPGITEKDVMASYESQFKVGEFLVNHGFNIKLERNKDEFNIAILDKNMKSMARVVCLAKIDDATAIIDNEDAFCDIDASIMTLDPFADTSKIFEGGKLITSYEDAKLADFYDLINTMIIADDFDGKLNPEARFNGEEFVSVGDLDSNYLMNLLTSNKEVLSKMSDFAQDITGQLKTPPRTIELTV
jgi:hypothetical protein